MVHALTFSEAGGHPKDEDAFLVQPHPRDEGCWLVCLADGQGGRAGGARAADLACRTVMEAARKCSPAQLITLPIWPELLRMADRAVAADPDAGFTTLLGFCVWNGSLAGASSGDSAVLGISAGGTIRELTCDQIKNPPVGSGAAVVVPFGMPLACPWRILALSDGVWKYAGWQRIRELAERHLGQALLDELQQSARMKGSGRFQDDFTVVLLEEWA